MNDLHPASATPEFIERKATVVRIFTPSGIVEGQYHHAPGVRLSDSLRNAATGERYILLTDASLRSASGADVDESVRHTPFILVASAHASMIVPLEDE